MLIAPELEEAEDVKQRQYESDVRAPPEHLKSYNFERYFGAQCTLSIKQQVRKLHQECFPEQHGGQNLHEESLEAFWSRVHGIHNPVNAVWFLLWRIKSAAAKPQLVGVATAVPYAKSLYTFNLGVSRNMRGLGLGKLILLQAQAYAMYIGLEKMTGTVENANQQQIKLFLDMSSRSEVMQYVVRPGATLPRVRMCDTFNMESLQESFRDHAVLMKELRKKRDNAQQGMRCSGPWKVLLRVLRVQMAF